MHVNDISLYINCVFYSGRIRTLVALATYSSHSLIIGKVEIETVFSVSLEIFEFFFHRYVYWVVLHVSYAFCPNLKLIGCRGDMKGKFLKNIKISYSH